MLKDYYITEHSGQNPVGPAPEEHGLCSKLILLCVGGIDNVRTLVDHIDHRVRLVYKGIDIVEPVTGDTVDVPVTEGRCRSGG